VKKAMIINYGLCTGCDTCVVSCAKEKGLPQGEWGMKIEQIGPQQLDGAWEWDYVPVPSRLCDLCAQRISEGKKAACELHCLAQVIEIVALEDVPTRMEQLGEHKVACYLP
jgi:Fe-S-cluster-containing dehydrogenase component